MTGFLCYTASGLEYCISLQHSPISQLAWEASSRQVGLTTHWHAHVQGIKGGDRKEEMPVTNAATSMSKGEASDHTRGPSCYQGSAQSCKQLCVCSITVRYPEVQPRRELGVWNGSSGCGLECPDQADPVGSLKPVLCVCLTCITVGGTALWNTVSNCNPGLSRPVALADRCSRGPRLPFTVFLILSFIQ